jgi:hypothetical protein
MWPDAKQQQDCKLHAATAHLLLDDIGTGTLVRHMTTQPSRLQHVY